MKIHIVSLGCPKNLTDTEVMMGLLLQAGHELTPDEKEAEIILVNTCAFIKEAEKEAFAILQQLAELKRKGNCRYLIAAGCLPQRRRQKLLKELPALDGIVGSGSIDKITQLINNLKARKSNCYLNGNSFLAKPQTPFVKATLPFTAYLKIADGCDNRCSYCTVPSIRGKFRSRPMATIIKETEELASSGVKEINLIAQDTTSYGLDLYGQAKLPQLLKKLEKIKGLRWIRLLYTHPAHITDELLKVIAKSSKICHYIDVPLQHSSNRILAAMRRKINRGSALKLIEKIRKQIPDVVLRSSFIVGFPGEQEKDFLDLLDFLKEVKLEKVGFFKYSREEGTAAENLRGQVAESRKKERLNRVISQQTKIAKEISKSIIGKELEVLIEKVLEKVAIGRSKREAPDIDGTIIVKGPKLKAGTMIKTRITQAHDYDLLGIPCH